MKEYVVWGVPPNPAPEDVELGLTERVLYTKATSQEEADRVAAILEKSHGCTKTRVQVLDLDAPGEDLLAAFAAAAKRGK